jgi:hypothetical protein
MLLGLVIFTIGRKHYIHAAQMKPKQEGDTKLSEILMKVFVPAIIAGVIGWFVPTMVLELISLEVQIQMPLFCLCSCDLLLCFALFQIQSIGETCDWRFAFDIPNQYVFLGGFQTEWNGFDKMGQLLHRQKRV